MTARERAAAQFAKGAQKRIAMAQLAQLAAADFTGTTPRWTYRSRKSKGRGLKGPRLNLHGSIAKEQHHHIRERARRLFRPGPERRAFIVAEMASVA